MSHRRPSRLPRRSRHPPDPAAHVRLHRSPSRRPVQDRLRARSVGGAPRRYDRCHPRASERSDRPRRSFPRDTRMQRRSRRARSDTPRWHNRPTRVRADKPRVLESRLISNALTDSRGDRPVPVTDAAPGNGRRHIWQASDSMRHQSRHPNAEETLPTGGYPSNSNLCPPG